MKRKPTMILPWWCPTCPACIMGTLDDLIHHMRKSCPKTVTPTLVRADDLNQEFDDLLARMGSTA